MTMLVIDIGDTPVSDRSRVILLDELKRVALAHLARLRLDEEPVVRFPGNVWTLMLHGCSRGCWTVDDGPKVR